MSIRNAELNDLEAIHKIEGVCFPPNQAASLNTLSERIKVFPQYFWLIEDNGTVKGFINGMITNYDTIKDEMFKNVHLHNENGTWQSVFGLAVLPEFQNKGYAGKLVHHLIDVSTQKTGKVLR